MSKWLTAVVFSALSFVLGAQKMELGLMGGLSLYSGDLSPQEFGLYFKELTPAGGLFVRINPNKALSLRLGLNLTRLSGEDGVSNNRNDRMLNFRTSVTEVSLTGEWNMFRLGTPRRTQVIPYLYAGAGFFRFNPETKFEDQWIELQPLGTEGQGLPGYEAPYSLTQVQLPFGGGIKFIVKERVTIGLEMGARKLFTDHLDDVSGAQLNYLDILEGNGILAAQLSNPTIKEPEENPSYRRGGVYNDWYFVGGLTFSFRFGEGDGVRGSGLGCPTF